MRPDHTTKPVRFRAFVLSLVSLEVAAQILSLSLLPAPGLGNGPCPSTRRHDREAGRLALGAFSNFFEVGWGDFFSSIPADGDDEEDQGTMQVELPEVQVVVREKTRTSTTLLPPAPARLMALAVDRDGPHSTPILRAWNFAVHLCRLTC